MGKVSILAMGLALAGCLAQSSPGSGGFVAADAAVTQDGGHDLAQADAADAATDSGDPCAASCKAEGKCHKIDGKCVPMSDEDCAKSDACQEDGKCLFWGPGVCLSADAALAKCYDACSKQGACTPKQGSCVK